MDRRTTTRYRRLPGRGPRKGRFFSVFLSRCSLYLGDDHILSVENNGFSEDYKRFYFADIQAIITRKTRSRDVGSIVFSLMIAGSLTGALLSKNESPRIFFWALSGIFLLLFLINLLRGPTCMCHIMTAVQEDQLPSLNRLRVARRVIGTLRLAVEKVQGTLRPEEVNFHEAEGGTHPSPSTNSLRRAPAGDRRTRHEAGTIHTIVFAFMLLDGILTAFDLVHHSAAIMAVSYLLTSAYAIGIVIALAKQHGSDIPGPVRSITWASLGFVFVSYFLSYVIMVTMLMTHRSKEMVNEWDLFRAMLNLSPGESPLIMAVYGFSAACSLALGGLGLVRMKKDLNGSPRGLRLHQNPGGEPAS